MSHVAPPWEPARNPIHRLIQYLDALAVAFGQFRQQSFHLPRPGQPDYTAERRSEHLRQLHSDFTAVTRRLFPSEDVASARTAGRLADDAVAELARNGRGSDEPLIRSAASWLGCWVGLLPTTGENLTDPNRHRQFQNEGEWLQSYHPIRANLIGLLARMGQTVPPAVRDREVFAAGAPNRPPVPAAELVRWVDDAQPVGEPTAGAVNPVVSTVLAHRRAEFDRDQQAEALNRERERIWEERLLIPVTRLRERWYAAWREVAGAVERDDAAATVEALTRAGGLFLTLRGVVKTWLEAAEDWRRRARSAGSHGRTLVSLGAAEESELGRWAALFDRERVIEPEPGDGPGAIPHKMARQYTSTHRPAEAGIHLLLLLAEGATTDQLAEFVRTTGGVRWLGGLTSALAAVVLPPDPGVRFGGEELPADDGQREQARFLIDAARIGLGGDYLARTRPLILASPIQSAHDPDQEGRTPASPPPDPSRPTPPPDPAGFADFYGRLTNALNWPDEHTEGSLETRAEGWAAWLANATWFATRAGYAIRWSDPPDPADMNAAEGRRILELAAAFERRVDSFVGRATLPQAQRAAAREMHTPFVLLLARVLDRTPPLRDQFKAAVLRAADDLWREYAAQSQRSAPAGEGQPETPTSRPDEGSVDPAADPPQRRVGSAAPDTGPTPVPAARPAADPIRQAMDEHARERGQERRWRAWEVRARGLLTAAAAALRDLAAAPNPYTAADLEPRFRAVGVALKEWARASREEHPCPPSPGERTEADRFRYLADPAHRHVPPAARVFAALVVAAVDTPGGLRERLDRLAEHPLLTEAMGWGAFLGEWQYGLRLRPEPGWQRMPSPPGSGSDMDAVTAGLDHREPAWVARQREQLAAFAHPPAADPPPALTGQPDAGETPATVDGGGPANEGGTPHTNGEPSSSEGKPQRNKPRRDPDKPGADRQNDIIGILVQKNTPLTRPEIVDGLKLKAEGKLGAHLAWMVKNGILINIPQRGYWPKDRPPPG